MTVRILLKSLHFKHMVIFCHILRILKKNLVPYYVNTQQVVKNEPVHGIQAPLNSDSRIDWAFITPNTLIVLGLMENLREVYSIDIDQFTAEQLGDICEPKTFIATCAYRSQLYTFGG